MEWPHGPDIIACDPSYGLHLIESDCLATLLDMSASNMSDTSGRADSQAYRDFIVPHSSVDSERVGVSLNSRT